MSVRHAILALLDEAPKYGMQLRQEFEARTGELWPLNVGQVYTTLQRLERDGLVSSDDADDGSPQKLFTITADGSDELEDWLRTPPEGAPPRDELVIKILVASHMPGVDLQAVVQEHRHALVSTMQQYTRMKAEASEDDFALMLVLDAEVYRLDGVIRWLDSVEARSQRRGPVTESAQPRASRERKVEKTR